MKSFKRVLCIICAAAVAVGTLPSVFKIGAQSNEENVTLSDGSQWLISANREHTDISTDGEGRYFVKTDVPNTADSEFSVMSKGVYPLSTEYQLRCPESANALTAFGLSSEYSLKMNSSNSVSITRKNGSPSENAVQLFVTVNGKSECIKTTAPSYVRNRVSAVTVVRKNDSWYMSWNGIVLDAEGCSEEAREYVKLENHFPAEALKSGLPLHFFASCSSMLRNEGFSFKADRTVSGGIMSVAADIYKDANNPDSVTKTTHPSASFEEGTYGITMSSAGTLAAVMSPVTQIGAENGSSGVFYAETYLENTNTSGQYWMEYSFSNDPTFSDNSEISFCVVKLANNGGAHIGYFNAAGSWITCAGMNNNFFNDPQNSKRHWQFRTDSKTGKIYLYLWGANLIAANSPFCISEDFTSLVGKPVYMRIKTRATGSAVAKINVTPDNADELSEIISAINETALKTPADLEQAERIISEYDSSPYRFAVSDEGLSNILKTRMYMFEEREKKLKAQLEALKTKIEALPEPDGLESVYSEQIKKSICDTYLEYTALGENMSRLESPYSQKLAALIDKLAEIDSEFADKKAAAESFGESVAAIKASGAITVDNYIEKNEKITALRSLYNDMDDFLKSFVDASALETLEELESRLPAVRAAYDVTTMINALPASQDTALSDETAITAARKAYNLLSDNSLVSPEVLKHLEECEARLEEVKLTELDWYSKTSEVKYTGDNKESYSFVSTADKSSGDVFATTTGRFDMVKNQLYWIGMGCGSSQFMLFGLANSVKGQQLSNSSADNISFILRPGAGNSLSVTFFDAKGENERTAVLTGYDLGGLHKFAFEKGEDGHWYLVIDGKRCDGFAYSRFDNYMETYGLSTFVSIGGRNGFRADNVLIADKASSEYTGDWDFSLPFGCSYTGDTARTELKIRNGAQAVYKPRISDLNKLSVNINAGLQFVRGSDTFVGFLKNSETSGNYACNSSNGVVLRFINRPSAGDNRTHILLLLNGKWVTMTAKEPAIMDADSYTLTVEQSTDHHWYLRVRWASGTVLVKFERNSEYYRAVQLDDLVENGGYFTFASNNTTGAIISMSRSSTEDNADEDESSAAAVGFILEFEKNFDKLNARSKETFEYMNAEWLKLNFLTRNSVVADLMDDDAAYNLLLEVMEYKDGNLDEYYTVSEEKLVSRDELGSLIAECKADDSADYVISFANDGTVIETVKNLSAPNKISVFSEKIGEKPYDTALCILAAAAACSVVCVAGEKRKNRGK